MTGPGVVRIEGLTRAFGERVVLDRLDLEIGPGELVALLGRSGSGKSTLVRTLAGLDPLDGPGDERALPVGRVAVAFQEPRLIPWMRVWRNVAVGLDGADAPSVSGTRRSAAVEMLARVGLADRADAWPGTLSGGEAQRVSLARALVREPDLLLLDEPFSSLDALTRLTMQHLVRRLHAPRDHAVLLVTHDVDEALLLADRVLVLDGGRVAAQHRVPGGGRDGLRRRLLQELGVGPEVGVGPEAEEVPEVDEDAAGRRS